MKVAIYSRVLDSTQQGDVQLLFDELDKEGITPVVYHSYLENIRRHISLPDY
jgi:NAD+ kinase